MSEEHIEEEKERINVRESAKIAINYLQGLMPEFGVTDLAIVEVIKRFRYLLFTDDRGLTGYMRNQHFDVLNLNDLRTVE